MDSYISAEKKCLIMENNPDSQLIKNHQKRIFSIPIMVYEILKYVSYFDLDNILPLFGLPDDMAQAIKQQIYSSRVKVATRFYYIEDQSDKYDGLARMLFADAGISIDDDSDDSNAEDDEPNTIVEDEPDNVEEDEPNTVEEDEPNTVEEDEPNTVEEDSNTADEPAKNNIGTYIEYRIEGKVHRDDGPAIEASNGDKEWWINGELHRDDDLPAVEFADGDKEWYLHGKKHRLNGPAIIHSDGEEYHVHDKLHRTDGPAIIRTNGDKEWWVNGRRHRTDGPAIEFAEGDKAWFVDGIPQRPPRMLSQVSQIQYV